MGIGSLAVQGIGLGSVKDVNLYAHGEKGFEMNVKVAGKPEKTGDS